MDEKYVYLFSEGRASMIDTLGDKGANLAEMTYLNLPVPPGFTVSTQTCVRYRDDGRKLNDNIKSQIFNCLETIENKCGKKLGNPENPLLLSVRSGAKICMPGMMDTILNLGINDEIVESLGRLTKNRRFAFDSYRRFIQMFSDVSASIPNIEFEKIIDDFKTQKGITLDSELNEEDLFNLVIKFKNLYKEKTSKDFPSNPKEQLITAIESVFASWDNHRADVYRRLNNIPYESGTAVSVQEMVFGNMGETSGTGVVFSRNPSTGENKLFGEFLINAQGEDVVAGIRTPEPISKMREVMPQVFDKFKEITLILENHFKDMQVMEFTIEDGKLYMLQTKSGKRTGKASLKIATDLVDENKITPDEAILMIDAQQLNSLFHRQFDKSFLKNCSPLSKGLAASYGAACGKVVFSNEEAKKLKEKNEKAVLVRLETSPEDIEGMQISEGILTARGGMTSHAAVVARGIGVCCVVGCEKLKISEDQTHFSIDGEIFNKGDFISIDGTTGNIYKGKIPTQEAEIPQDFYKVMSWADKSRRMQVKANADTPKDALTALKFGAEGIGLCRTEHMFFNNKRIKSMRKMILSNNENSRKEALAEMLPYQQHDFEEIFKILKGLPVTIRLLDPPLHEFLPNTKEELMELANDLGITLEKISETIINLHEFNPMMGHRGCRLAVSYPEIAQMQTTAIISAAINVNFENSAYKIEPEIMIPLVGETKEFLYVKKIIENTADEIIANSNSNIKYKIGTMIEVPRAALISDEIAEHADFFSFGTNDLTQMTFGFSRDDAAKFLDCYYSNRIYESDPFSTIDIKGVGRLIKISSSLSRKANPQIKLGVCGEHGGEPASIEFYNTIGLDYVSCSPFRIPAAKLASAQAAIKNKS